MKLIDEIIRVLETLPEVAVWPELAALFARADDDGKQDWYIPLRTCRALGGGENDGLVAAAAIACLQVSIILVDDMLDYEPGAEYERRGHGPTANLALALGAIPFRLTGQLTRGGAARAAVVDCLSHIALATACGQNLDVQNLRDEADYWRVVEAKSTPFYGGAFQLGALVAGASAESAQRLYDFGVLIGEIIQIEDDIKDAYAQPANPDWVQGRNNLLMLYARTAPHEARERFLTLLGKVEEEERLAEAQDILTASGALSFAAYHLIARFREARRLLDDLALPDERELAQMLAAYRDSLLRFLEISGETVDPAILDLVEE